MEASCAWLLDTLRGHTAASLHTILSRHRASDNDFNLSDVLAFLPCKQHAEFARLLRSALSSSVHRVASAAAKTDSVEDSDDDLEEHVNAVKTAAEIVWLFVRGRRETVVQAMRDVVFDLHGVLLAMPAGQPQNLIAKICEWLWHSHDEEREKVVPQTMLYLLLRSFGGESEALLAEGKPSRNGGSAKDVSRVYAMRDALDCLELSEDAPESDTIRNLLMRCSTSAVYLRVDSGRKFLTYLLSVEDVRDAILATLLNQVATVRKTRAIYYGGVLLVAWKHDRSQWMFDAIMRIVEKAIYAGTERFAANLRTVLSSFHSNKRVPGVDAFLNRIYGPVLYKNLVVANARVRRNAVMIMADAFPIHDPSSLMQDIEQTIAFQCGRLLDLLDDPAPIVRKSTVEGTCRILGLLWELVPLGSAKKMIEVITTKLAFDAASAQVRVAVFEGLEFLAHNHLAHQILSVALPRLGSLIHDNVERVRLSFLDLLVTLKSKRIRTLRYFDVVPLDDLLLRLPIESPAASTKIMSLIVSSYFPLERKGKTAEEVASSQIRACISMLHTSREACSYFYQNVNLHVPPGPLCEFVMRLSAIALDCPADAERLDCGEETKAPPSRPSTRRTRRRSRTKFNDENEATLHDNIVSEGHGPKSQKSGSEPDRVTLLSVAADVLASVLPSLGKKANSALRVYIDDIFGGDALQSLLVERDNTTQSRAVCWRIASCMSYSHMTSISVLWREQLDTVLEWPRRTDRERQNFEVLLSALILCGIRWNLLTPLSTVVSGWADAATSGHRTARLGTKSIKKSGARKSRRGSKSASRNSTSEGRLYMTRCNALFALRSCASVVMSNRKLREELDRLFSGFSSFSDQDGVQTDVVQLFRSLRKGSIGAVDFMLENDSGEAISEEERPALQNLLDCLALSWKLCLTRLSHARFAEYLLEEFRELLQWSSGRDLLKQASQIDTSFAQALSCLILSYSADAVAIGRLDKIEMLFLESIRENIKSRLLCSDSSNVTRPVAEMLRISYQLGVQYSFVDGEAKDSDSLLTTSQSFLSTACEIMNSCQVVEEYRTGFPRPLTVLDRFLLDTFGVKCHSKDPEVFRNILGELLRTCFGHISETEGNLLASSVSNIVSSLVTSPRNSGSLTAVELHGLVLSCIQPDRENAGSEEALINYILLLVTSIHYLYEESEIAPIDDGRRFLASVEVAFNEQFPMDDISSSDNGDMQKPISEIRECLAKLKKLCRPLNASDNLHRDEGRQGDGSPLGRKPER